MRRLRSIMGGVSLCAAALLAACGGGGGGGDLAATSSTTTSAPTPTASPSASPVVVPAASGMVKELVITDGNAMRVTAEALQTASGQDLGSVATSLVVGVEIDASGAPAGAAQLAQAARRLLALAPRTAPLVTGVTTTESVPCGSGGALQVTSNTAQEDAMKVGDEVRMSASGCVETVDGVSVRMNGAMALKIVAGGVDPASARLPVEFTMRISVDGFQLTAAGTTTTLLGEMDAAVVAFSETSLSITMTSAGLRSTIAGAAGTRTETLRAFRQRLESYIAGERSLDFSATVETSGSALGTGTIVYHAQTITPLRYFANKLSGGVLEVVGSGSKLQAWLNGPEDVILYVDSDGDGQFEKNSNLRQSQQQALL